jgi:hypothetical protein
MTHTTNDGGPAFPIPGVPGAYHDAGCGDTYTTSGIAPRGGMSLRDYFAAKAMEGMQAHPANERPGGVADWAYKIADAMLAERSKP